MAPFFIILSPKRTERTIMKEEIRDLILSAMLSMIGLLMMVFTGFNCDIKNGLFDSNNLVFTVAFLGEMHIIFKNLKYVSEKTMPYS